MDFPRWIYAALLLMLSRCWRQVAATSSDSGFYACFKISHNYNCPEDSNRFQWMAMKLNKTSPMKEVMSILRKRVVGSTMEEDRNSCARLCLISDLCKSFYYNQASDNLCTLFDIKLSRLPQFDIDPQPSRYHTFLFQLDCCQAQNTRNSSFPVLHTRQDPEQELKRQRRQAAGLLESKIAFNVNGPLFSQGSVVQWADNYLDLNDPQTNLVTTILCALMEQAVTASGLVFTSCEVINYPKTEGTLGNYVSVSIRLIALNRITDPATGTLITKQQVDNLFLGQLTNIINLGIADFYVGDRSKIPQLVVLFATGLVRTTGGNAVPWANEYLDTTNAKSVTLSNYICNS
ncbi:hypothetical protein Ciccas_007716, partial [Cichlidogyrus casuarinus]